MGALNFIYNLLFIITFSFMPLFMVVFVGVLLLLSAFLFFLIRFLLVFFFVLLLFHSPKSSFKWLISNAFHPKQNKNTNNSNNNKKDFNRIVFEEFHIIWYLGLFLISIFVCDLTQRIKYKSKSNDEWRLFT